MTNGALAADGDGPIVLVGDGWAEPSVALPDFFGRAAAWATAARRGPFPFAGTLLINTHPDYGPAALRTLLLAAPERAVLIAPRRDLVAAGFLPAPDPSAHIQPEALARFMAAAYDIAALPTGPGGDPAVILVARHDRPPAGAAEAVLRHIVLHPGAKVVNAWRDALVAAAGEAGTPMTKNEARSRIAADRLDPSLRQLRSLELPLRALGSLVDEITRSAAET